MRKFVIGILKEAMRTVYKHECDLIMKICDQKSTIQETLKKIKGVSILL